MAEMGDDREKGSEGGDKANRRLEEIFVTTGKFDILARSNIIRPRRFLGIGWIFFRDRFYTSETFC